MFVAAGGLRASSTVIWYFKTVPMRSLVAAAVLLAALPGVARAQSLIAQDAGLADIEFATGERSFEFAEADGTRAASRWRVIEGTGNSAETHIVTDAAGRL